MNVREQIAFDACRECYVYSQKVVKGNPSHRGRNEFRRDAYGWKAFFQVIDDPDMNSPVVNACINCGYRSPAIAEILEQREQGLNQQSTFSQAR
jgi:hypothetical protein